MIAVGGTNSSDHGEPARLGGNGVGRGRQRLQRRLWETGWQTDPLCTMRMEADISVVGAPGTGVAVYGPTSATASAWLVFGGTSVGAPLIAGMYAAKGCR